MAQVPDTNTFTLQDVVDVISPSSETLLGCYDDVDSDEWDATYNVDPSSLLNFRNYGGILVHYDFRNSSDTDSVDGGEETGILITDTYIDKAITTTVPAGGLTFRSTLSMKTTDQNQVTPCDVGIRLEVDYYIKYNTSKEIIWQHDAIHTLEDSEDTILLAAVDSDIQLTSAPSPFLLDCSINLEMSGGSGCIGHHYDVIVTCDTTITDSSGNISIGNTDHFEGKSYWYNAVKA